MTTSLIRSVYVHVPFCRTLCGYCDFYSRPLDPEAVSPYVDAITRELGCYAERFTLEFDTVYVGGGTPTVLSPAALARLLAAVRPFIAAGVPVEFTVEANPATVTSEIADVLLAAGVNRVSLGAQSFDSAELRTLDRVHRPEQVEQTVAECRRAGIANLSLDLIFGVPGQTLGSWLRSLTAALVLQPNHVSCYGLTYEPDTPLWEKLAGGRVRRVDEESEAQMYEAALDILPAVGLAHYEISNFARPGAECQHNLRCWHNEPYLGLGPAAAGYLDGMRYKNVSDTAAYVRAVQAGQSPWCEHERLLKERRVGESAMLLLRLADGIDRVAFQRRYGEDPATLFSNAVRRHVDNGLLMIDERRIRLTRAGFLMADTVMADFL